LTLTGSLKHLENDHPREVYRVSQFSLAALQSPVGCDLAD
jgi:hypothetical protein